MLEHFRIADVLHQELNCDLIDPGRLKKLRTHTFDHEK